jgi:hypothetical protein
MLLDVTGEQVKLPVGRIPELVGLSAGPLCMQLWLSAGTDVVCSVRYVAPDTQVLTFVLGGLTENERKQAIDAVRRLIQWELGRTVALLVDPGGETADEASCRACRIVQFVPRRCPSFCGRRRRPGEHGWSWGRPTRSAGRRPPNPLNRSDRSALTRNTGLPRPGTPYVEYRGTLPVCQKQGLETLPTSLPLSRPPQM